MTGALERAMRAMWRASIWAPGAVPSIEGETSRELKRTVLPVFDVFLIIMAIGAVRNGMPSFEMLHNTILSSASAWVLLAGSVSALVGISFPRLWGFEAAGKVTIVLVLSAYSGALWTLVILGDGNRALTAGAFLALTVLPMWNLARLGRERRRRRGAS